MGPDPGLLGSCLSLYHPVEEDPAGESTSTVSFEPPRGKTNNVVSEQVRHKPTCTVTD